MAEAIVAVAARFRSRAATTIQREAANTTAPGRVNQIEAWTNGLCDSLSRAL